MTAAEVRSSGIHKHATCNSELCGVTGGNQRGPILHATCAAAHATKCAAPHDRASSGSPSVSQPTRAAAQSVAHKAPCVANAGPRGAQRRRHWSSKATQAAARVNKRAIDMRTSPASPSSSPHSAAVGGRHSSKGPALPPSCSMPLPPAAQLALSPPRQDASADATEALQPAASKVMRTLCLHKASKDDEAALAFPTAANVGRRA